MNSETNQADDKTDLQLQTSPTINTQKGFAASTQPFYLVTEKSTTVSSIYINYFKLLFVSLNIFNLIF
jgi:hypothetical protein